VLTIKRGQGNAGMLFAKVLTNITTMVAFQTTVCNHFNVVKECLISTDHQFLGRWLMFFAHGYEELRFDIRLLHGALMLLQEFEFCKMTCIENKSKMKTDMECCLV
jgi:hypothetical protein